LKYLIIIVIIPEPDCRVSPWQWNTIQFYVSYKVDVHADNDGHTHLALVGKPTQKIESIFYCTYIGIHINISDRDRRSDISRSKSVVERLILFNICISFLYRVNEHRCAGLIYKIHHNNITIITTTCIWLWWDVTSRWSPCAVWCVRFPIWWHEPPPYPSSNYVSQIRPSAYIRDIYP